METANSSWIPQFGTKSDRKMLGAAGQHAEPADADEQIEALDEDIVFDAAAFSVHDDAPVRLTMQLIRESSALAGLEMSEPSDSTVSDEHDESSGDEVDELLRKKVLRLDWLNIGRIENLDAFTHVRELYLQHNLIERIENLDDHAELTFLALGGNRIHKVEGLRHLSKLRFLDLSDNQIEDFETTEFPPSLMILRLADNPFVRHMPAYAHLFFERFPTIVQVDQFRREAESSVSSVSSDDGDGAATVAPVSAPIYSPRSLKVDLEAEAQRYKRILMSPPTSSIENSMDGKETTMFDAEAASDTTLELEEYEQQRNERIAKWKEQLDALSSRKLQLEDDARPVITRVATAMSSQVASNFHTKRVEAMERAQTSTEAAIADATKHFHEMEAAHHEWQQDYQNRVSSPN